jgi:hypothetical protein
VTPLRQDVVFRRHYLDQTGSQSERHVRLVHRDLRLTRVPMTFRMMPRVTPVIGLSIATKDEEKTIMGPHIRVNRRCLFWLVTAPLLGAQTGDRSSIDGFVTRDMAAVSGATIGSTSMGAGMSNFRNSILSANSQKCTSSSFSSWLCDDSARTVMAFGEAVKHMSFASNPGTAIFSLNRPFFSTRSDWGPRSTRVRPPASPPRVILVLAHVQEHLIRALTNPVRQVLDFIDETWKFCLFDFHNSNL